MSSKAAVETRRRLFAYFCYLYIALGLFCLSAGVYLVVVALAHSGNHARPDPWYLMIAAILIVFGLLRAVLAVWRLRVVQGKRGTPSRHSGQSL